MHTEIYLSLYLSIPSVTFRYGQTPSDIHLLRSLAYKPMQWDVSNRCLLTKYSHAYTDATDAADKSFVSIRSVRNNS